MRYGAQEGEAFCGAESYDLEPRVSRDECDCAMQASCAMTVRVEMSRVTGVSVHSPRRLPGY